MSGFRQLHIARGMDPRNIGDRFINLVLKGKRNKDAADKHAGTQRTRFAIMLNMIMLLKKLIRQWERPQWRD